MFTVARRMLNDTVLFAWFHGEVTWNSSAFWSISKNRRED